MSQDPPSQSPAKVAARERMIVFAERQTSMAFNRTHQSLDRTLMSQIRTSLALITFGFTIYQAFRRLQGDVLLFSPGGGEARAFGAALVLAGMVMQTLGILHHFRSLKHLRDQRALLFHQGIPSHASAGPPPFTIITAGLLWLIGLFAVLAIVFGP